MADTAIEWAESGGEPSGSIAADVVPAYEATRAAVAIKEREGGAATTFTTHIRVGLTGSSQVVAQAVFGRVLPSGQHFQIFGPVVLLVAVDVVDNLAAPQRPTERFRGDEAVFVHIAATVSHGMSPPSHQNIPIGCDRAAAFPLRVLWTECSDSIAHQSIIAIGRDQRVYQN